MTQELKAILTNIGNAVVDLRAEYDEKFEALDKAVGRMAIGGGGGSTRSDNRSNPEHKAAFESFLRHGGDVDSLNKLAIKNGLSTVSDPDGGATVPEEWEKYIDRQEMDAVAMRRICRVIRRRGQYKKPMSLGGCESGWVGELEDRNDTMWKEIFAQPGATQAIVDDSEFDIEAWLQQEISDSFIAKEGYGFIRGDAVKQVPGILSYNTVDNQSWEYQKVGYITSGLSSSLSADSLRNLKTALKPGYRRNGIWLMNDSTLNVISKMKNGEGDYIWREGLAAGDPNTILGYRVEIDENMDDIGAGSYPIAFADWQRGYTIVDHEAGVRVLRDPYSRKGKIFWYTTKRIKSGISDFSAIKLMKIAA